MQFSRTLKAIALVLCLSTGTTASASVVLFEDHFDGGTMSAEWVSLRPRQWVQDGWLHTQSDDSVPGRNSDAVTHDGDVSWTDCKFTLTVDPLLTSTWENAFVFFRVSNAHVATHGIWFDGYALHFWGPAAAAGPSLSLYHCNSNEPQSSHPLFSTTDWPKTSDPWEVVIRATGPRIKVRLDGELVIDVVDPDPFLHGGVGIGAIWETETRFDDVVVVPEPCVLLLLTGGLVHLATRRRGSRTRT